MTLHGLVLIGIGLLFVLFPERVARGRLRGATDPTPTASAIRQVRWVGGPLLLGVGLLLFL